MRRVPLFIANFLQTWPIFNYLNQRSHTRSPSTGFAKMEAQMQRPAHQHIEHNVGLQSGEKKSVMKKVKDKARKIKDTVKKGRGQEHENVDEEDVEIANDREIHDPDSSSVISSTNLPMQLDHTRGYEQQQTPESKHLTSPTKSVSLHREEENAGEPEVKLGPSMGLEKDPHFGAGDAPSNYESKVSDPTGEGGKEAGVGPLIRRFDHLNVGNEPGQKAFTGSHDQFSPTLDPSYPESNPESEPKLFDSSDTTTGRTSSATTGLIDKAIYVKNALASKLGYGGDSSQEVASPSKNPKSESTPGYTQRISDTLNPVYDKVAGAGTAVTSKFQGSGEDGNQAEGPGHEDSVLSDKPESESAPGYTKRIADTWNPVYDKVAGAGPAVTSKLQGNGEGGDAAASGTENGVSVKDYWTEKLKPEDQATTDALHEKKEGYLKRTEEEKPVTESEDVATRRGKREGEDAFDSGPGVVGRVKDAV